MKLWDTETWREMLTFRGHTGQLSSLAFSPDSRLVASADFSWEGVKLWNAQDGKIRHVLNGHWGMVYRVAFSPKGRRLATAGADRRIKIWNTANGHEVLTLSGHTDTIYNLAFSPDGRQLASVGAGTAGGPEMIHLWEASDSQDTANAIRPALPTPAEVLFWHLGEVEESLNRGERFAARWHMERLGDALPQDATLCVRMGNVNAEFLHWHKAVVAYGKATQSGPIGGGVWRQYALACLKDADRAAYGRACTTLVDSVRKAPRNREDTYLAAWTCAVGPGAVTNYAEPIAWAERVLAKLVPEDIRWRQDALNTVGALLYRAGRYPEALDRLTAAVAVNNGQGVSRDWIFLAMVHHRLGHAAEAKASLGRVNLPAPVPEARLSWDALELELLQHEAEALLAGKNE